MAPCTTFIFLTTIIPTHKGIPIFYRGRQRCRLTIGDLKSRARNNATHGVKGDGIGICLPMGNKGVIDRLPFGNGHILDRRCHTFIGPSHKGIAPFGGILNGDAIVRGIGGGVTPAIGTTIQLVGDGICISAPICLQF